MVLWCMLLSCPFTFAATGEEDDPLMGMEEIWERLKLVPILDTRNDDEILGYGPDGLPS